MSILARLLETGRRIVHSVRRRRRERDIDDELAFHLAMRRESLAAEGNSRDDAARLARRQFGNVQVIKEQTQDMWTLPSLESIVQDARYALRALWRTPAFSVVAILALTLGIGANSAIFSLVNAVFVRGLPYAHADRLVLLIGNVRRDKVERRGNSWPDYEDWRRQSSSFDDMGSYAAVDVRLMSVDEPARLNAEAVSSSYFSVLGASAAMGRVFTPAEDVENGPAVAVLSDTVWRVRFGADRAILGRTVTLGSRPFEVIGVMPPGFTGITDTADVWMPFPFGWGSLSSRSSRGFQSVARLKPGVTREAAQTELTAISAQLAAAHPDTNEQRGVEVADLAGFTFESVSGALKALMAAVVFVLLIACANVATLVVARAEVRAREIAIRAALGAGQTRLMRQLVTESVVLCAVAGPAGLAFAAAALRVLTLASPVTLPTFAQPVLDARVVWFTVGISLGTAILLSLAPALHMRVATMTEALRTTRGATAGSSRRLRSALVVLEIALTVMLLVGAGLMIRSVANLARVDPGFTTRGVLTMDVGLPRVSVPGSQGPAPLAVSVATLLDRVRAVPGVQQAALVSDVPLASGGSAVFYAAEGDGTAGAQKAPRAYVHRVSPNFFATMGVPLAAGRAFQDSEMTQTSTSVIVSAGVARRFWPNQDPIGRRIKLGAVASQSPWLTIVGVVPELKYRALPVNPTADPDLFLPIFDRGQVGLVIRAAGGVAALTQPVQSAIRGTAAGFVIFNVQSLESLADSQTASSRFTTWLLSVFAAAALMLAAIGIYGIMQYLVDQRRREFGIRLALGATRRGIVGLVARNSVTLIAVGTAIGALGSWQVARWLGAQLFGVSAFDASGVAAVGVLVAVAFIACVVPAVRATRVDPAASLRND